LNEKDVAAAVEKVVEKRKNNISGVARVNNLMHNISEQKPKRIKFDDLPIDEQKEILKARRARKTQLQWEKRERDRKAAGKSPPKTQKEQNLEPKQLWNAFYNFVESKGDIDSKNLYFYKCYKWNKYKMIKEKIYPNIT
jgi:hypothetical protein